MTAEKHGAGAWTALLVVFCAIVLRVLFAHIAETLPYPRDIDEGAITGPALRMLTTGTLHPYTFNYPSLPKYLTAVGMAGGFLRGAGRFETRDIQRVGNVGFPYYETPIVVGGARQLFAFLSVVMLFATGMSAWLVFRRPSTLVLAPLALALTPLFFYHSWVYLNVDLVGSTFVMLTLAATLDGTRRPSIAHSAILPGLCAGLATGSKYTLAFAILPVLAGIFFHGRNGQRGILSLLAIGSMVVAFVLVVPFSLIDIPAFLNGIADEARHYASGHPGYDGPTGFPQLVFYLRHFVGEFGLVGVAAAIVGLAASLVRDWRRVVLVLVFPLGLIGLLMSQRVHFTRNVLSVQPFIAMFLAYGVLVVCDWLAAKSWWSRPGLGAIAFRAAATIALVAIAVSAWHLRDELRSYTDSRTRAETWIASKVPSDWTIVVPKELGFNQSGLAARGFRVTTLAMASTPDLDSFSRALADVQKPAVILLPEWGADVRYRGQEVAPALNQLSSRWQPLQRFGSNPVLVNYGTPVPWGDPTFSIASLEGRPLPSRP